MAAKHDQARENNESGMGDEGFERFYEKPSNKAISDSDDWRAGVQPGSIVLTADVVDQLPLAMQRMLRELASQPAATADID